MRILLAGGAGFLGSHLAEALVAQGDYVVILDNLSSGLAANIKGSLLRHDPPTPGPGFRIPAFRG